MTTQKYMRRVQAAMERYHWTVAEINQLTIAQLRFFTPMC